jgi:hypothetical protein
MKKRLNTNQVVNELTGQSAFFKETATEETPASVTIYEDVEKDSERNSERKSDRTENRSEFRTVALPIRRRARRYSFEIYDDQIVKTPKCEETRLAFLTLPEPL